MVTSVIKLRLVSCMMTCTTYGSFMIVDHHYSILHVYVPLGINLSRSRLALSDSFFSILEIVLHFNVFYNCILVWGCALLKQYCSHAAGLRYFPVLIVIVELLFGLNFHFHLELSFSLFVHAILVAFYILLSFPKLVLMLKSNC